MPTEQFYFLKSPDGSVKKFRRTGECSPSSCNSACCRIMVVSANQGGETGKDDVNRLYSYRGMRKMTETDPAGNEREFYVAEMPCGMLSSIGLCKVYQRRPKACVGAPYPDIGWLATKKVCTYGWELVE
jgi:Fe-S-cluster containining protein